MVDKVTLNIHGMTCVACVRRVESALKTVEGVSDATVNLATGRATVIHHPDWANIGGLGAAISSYALAFSGSVMVNVVPTPSSLSTVMSPP